MTTHTHSSEIRNRTFAGKRMRRATEIHPMYSFRFQQTQLRPVLTLSIGLVAFAGTQKTIKVSGIVHGGQQPVSQATIQLYSVGTGGLKSASNPLIGSTIQTGSDGSFNITGAYNNCTGATQVYIVATGGNAGSGTNSSIALAAALGPCSSLNSGTYIVINEVSTIAAAYALAPFASDFAHIGATGSNPTGLVNAFASAALLANTAVGSAGGASVPAGVTVPLAEINTLADVVSACINTAGSSSNPCIALFSATGATETFGASLAIAKNPGASAVTALYSLSVPTAPFQPTLTGSSAPNDFTIAINATAGGTLATPYGIAIDASGNAWVTNETGSAVSELSASGGLLASPPVLPARRESPSIAAAMSGSQTPPATQW